jgi:hypothetical protein
MQFTDIEVSSSAATQIQIVRWAEHFQRAGNWDAGRQTLIDAIDQGNWDKNRLWWRLVGMITSAGDYEQIHNLWLRSPASCHENASIIRAVARAAAVTGNHGDCRRLLRNLIIKIAGDHDHRVASISTRVARKLQSFRRRARTPRKNTGADEFADAAAIALADLNQAFSEVGVKTFLISGTLLGLIREGGIISWDKDIDVGYFSEDCNVDLEACFVDSENFRIGRVDLTAERVRVIHSNGTWIDIFPHYMENGRLWHNGTSTRWWNAPFGLRTIHFIGIDQYIPDDAELYLDENYGDWRTPDANFDARIDAPNVEISDLEHFTSLLFFSLEKSLRKKNEIMKRRYIDLLRQYGERGWLASL